MFKKNGGPWSKFDKTMFVFSKSMVAWCHCFFCILAHTLTFIQSHVAIWIRVALQLADALPTELYTPHPTDLRRILQLLPTLYFTNPRIVMKEQGVDILVCDFCKSFQPVFHWQSCSFEENIRFYTKAKFSYKLIVQKNKWEYSMRLGVTHGYAIHTHTVHCITIHRRRAKPNLRETENIASCRKVGLT